MKRPADATAPIPDSLTAITVTYRGSTVMHMTVHQILNALGYAGLAVVVDADSVVTLSDGTTVRVVQPPPACTCELCAPGG